MNVHSFDRNAGRASQGEKDPAHDAGCHFGDTGAVGYIHKYIDDHAGFARVDLDAAPGGALAGAARRQRAGQFIQ